MRRVLVVTLLLCAGFFCVPSFAADCDALKAGVLKAYKADSLTEKNWKPDDPCCTESFGPQDPCDFQQCNPDRLQIYKNTSNACDKYQQANCPVDDMDVGNACGIANSE